MVLGAGKFKIMALASAHHLVGPFVCITQATLSQTETASLLS